MKNIKYTTDGRKVVVIGDLNQTEKIVQEIFVTEDGAEIPSGERFVVKSLLDAPAKSWKERELQKLEETFKKDKEYWDSRIKKMQEEKQLVYSSLSARVKWLKNVAKQPHPDKLKAVIETLSLFLSNTDIWVFYADYSMWHLEKYDQDGISRIHDNIDSDYYRTKLEDMKLLSLFGKSNGDFQWRISTYSDGSGSTKDVEYFKSKEDALKYIQNRFKEVGTYNLNHLKIAEKFGLEIDKEKLEEFRLSQEESILKNIQNLKENLKKCNADLDEIKKL